jgi:hypothetical protein
MAPATPFSLGNTLAMAARKPMQHAKNDLVEARANALPAPGVGVE